MRRRQFLQAASAAAAITIVPRHVLGGQGNTPPSEKLNIAGVGVGGQGAGDLREMATESIVALCDVDWRKAAGTFKTYPKAERFRDFRQMLDKCRSIEAVMIATPDHMHAPITVAALRSAKHVYVEKPMAHSIEEARVMTRVAKETGLVTQMGNNGHAGEGLRLTREWLQAGAIGPVREVHCWSGRPTLRPCRRTSTGTSGSAPLPCGRTIRSIIQAPGGVGLISARGPWATWPSTTWTRPFLPWTSMRRWQPRRKRRR
jgi:hypothetical protein